MTYEQQKRTVSESYKQCSVDNKTSQTKRTSFSDDIISLKRKLRNDRVEHRETERSLRKVYLAFDYLLIRDDVTRQRAWLVFGRVKGTLSATRLFLFTSRAQLTKLIEICTTKNTSLPRGIISFTVE